MDDSRKAERRAARTGRGGIEGRAARRRPRMAFSPLMPRPLPGSFSGRYSHFVTGMKILLPSAAAVLIALVVLWPQIQETGHRFRLGFARIAPGEANAVRMVKVRYTGVDRKDRPFTITADSATQVGETATQIALRMPQADVALKGGAWIALAAENGFYAPERRLLDLEGAVTLFHDQGYEMRTERAHVDLAAGIAESTSTVRGQGLFGELTAEGFHIRDEGKTVLFTGKARLLLYPQDDAES